MRETAIAIVIMAIIAFALIAFAVLDIAFGEVPGGYTGYPTSTSGEEYVEYEVRRTTVRGKLPDGYTGSLTCGELRLAMRGWPVDGAAFNWPADTTITDAMVYGDPNHRIWFDGTPGQSCSGYVHISGGDGFDRVEKRRCFTGQPVSGHWEVTIENRICPP